MADAEKLEKEAQIEKELGNAAYMEKKFEEAHQCYDRAIQLDPTNITFYTNKAAVYFEQCNFVECIKICEQAVSVGQNNQADCKLIAKAFARMGKAYKRKSDLKNALLNFNKSLAEHKAPDVEKLVKEISEEELRGLDDRETELACSLKELIKSEGGSASAGTIFVKMGNIHKERALLTKCVQHCVTASALYNAALIRTKDEELVKGLEATVRENEQAFCDLLSLPGNKVPVDYKADVKNMLDSIRKRVSPTAEKLLEDYNKALQLDPTETERLSLEKEFVEETRKVFNDMCSDIISLDGLLMSKAEEILGSPPQEYAAIAMGSLARGEATPFSDLEWAILVQDESKDLEYFRNLVRLVHLFVLNFGETYLRTMSIKSLNDYYTPGGNWFLDDVVARGFEFDSAAPYACKTPLGRADRPDRPGIELIRTPEKMAEICEYDTALKEGYIFDRILSTTVKLHGSQGADRLVEEFKEKRKKYKADGRVLEKVHREVMEILQEFRPQRMLVDNMVNDVKQDMFRLPTVIMSLLKTLFGVDSEFTWDVLSEMEDKKMLTEDGCHNLLVVVSIVALLRLVMYCQKSCQGELLSWAPQTLESSEADSKKVTRLYRYKPILIRYAYTIFPFADCVDGIDLQTICKSKKLDGVFYDQNYYHVGLLEQKFFAFDKARHNYICHIETRANNSSLEEMNSRDFMDVKYGPEGKNISCNVNDDSVLSCLRLIGGTYHAEGHFREASEFYTYAMNAIIRRYKHTTLSKSCLESIKEVGDKSSFCGQVLHDMCEVYYILGHYDLALDFANYSLKIFQSLKILRATIYCRKSIGMICCALVKYDEALGNYNSALDGLKNDCESFSLQILKYHIIHRKGLVYERRGNHDLALESHKEALNGLQEICGYGDHFQIASGLRDVGSAYANKAEYELGLKYFKDSLSMCRTLTKDEDHIATMGLLRNIGNLYIKMERMVKLGLEYCEKSLEMCKRIFDNADHPEIAACLLKLGVAFGVNNEHHLALQSFIDSLRIWRKFHGYDDHPEIASCLTNLALAYYNTQNYQSALFHFEQAKDMTIRLFGESQPSKLASLLKFIRMVRNAMGNDEETS